MSPAHRPPAVAQRDHLLLDGMWTFTSEGAGPVDVIVPHTWNAEDGYGADRDYARTTALYRRALPAESRPGVRSVLYFEGVNQTASVQVAGRAVGGHRGGYTAFALDVTDALAAHADAPVELEVVVDNRHDPAVPPLHADFTFFGGIYRHVWLLTVPDVHLGFDDGGPGLRVDTIDSDGGTSAELVATVLNDGLHDADIGVEFAIGAPDGAELGRTTVPVTVPGGGRREITATLDISEARRWSQDDPALHVARAVVHTDGASDAVEVEFGVRTLSLRDGQLFVDATPARTVGTARHQDVGGLGTAVGDDDHRRDIRLLADLGFGAVRLAHYPQAEAVLDEADRRGLIVWEEIPVVSTITPGTEFADTCLQMQREMIAQHRHHASIALWGYMNEVLIIPPEGAGPDYDAAVCTLAQRLEQECRALDPSRLTVMACNHLGGPEKYDRLGLADLPMVVGWNIYAGWYEGTFDDLGRFLDAQHAAHPERAVWVSEFGADCIPDRHAAAPRRPDGSMEWAQRYHEEYVRQLRERPWLAGATSWVGFDFGVAGRGDPRPGYNTKGLFTADRHAKDTAALYRAVVSRDPQLHLCGTDWRDRDAGAHELVIYTNLGEVEVMVDGAIATYSTDGPVLRLPLELGRGTTAVEVAGIAPDGTRLLRAMVVTAR